MSKIIKKETLIILSGWTRDRESYKKLVELAPSHWNVHIPSYRELKPHKGASVFRENLLKFLEKQNLSKINLLGHSLGGALAIHFAYGNHKIVKRLFLVDSKGLYKLESLFYRMKNFYREHATRTLRENISDFFRTIGNPILNFRLGLLAHYADVERQAAQIKVDTSIFWGEHDYMAPLVHGKKLKNLIPNSKLFVVKGLGHDWILHYPENFWEHIES